MSIATTCIESADIYTGKIYMYRKRESLYILLLHANQLAKGTN